MIRKALDIYSVEYPEYLRSIKDPPERLYYQGDLSLLHTRRVAMVGSRKFTLYGKVMARTIGKRMAEAGVTVVSGLAYGIDDFSHQGVIETGGNAIAVLGMGIDRFAPEKNRREFDWICEHGLVVSEYEDGFTGSPYSFPQRNRIISGLSENIILVEAGFKSGALITANIGLEQGRGIYAVPGNINSQFSMGTNLLIRNGARPLVIIDDILRDMGIDPSDPNAEEPDLGADEIPVYEIVRRKGSVSIDDIASELGKRVEQVGSILTVMEIKGLIITYGGKIHLAN